MAWQWHGIGTMKKCCLEFQRALRIYVMFPVAHEILKEFDLSGSINTPLKTFGNHFSMEIT